MDILIQMVADRISRGEVTLMIGGETVDWAERECMAVLARIREILADDALGDPECFARIERIVCEMEAIGLSCGGRHDFG